jgi:hypothetical protein
MAGRNQGPGAPTGKAGGVTVSVVGHCYCCIRQLSLLCNGFVQHWVSTGGVVPATSYQELHQVGVACALEIHKQNCCVVMQAVQQSHHGMHGLQCDRVSWPSRSQGNHRRTACATADRSTLAAVSDWLDVNQALIWNVRYHISWTGSAAGYCSTPAAELGGATAVV